MEANKRGGGRPKWIPSPETFKKIEGFASRGLTLEQIAGCLGVAYDTLNERSKEYPEISDAIKSGRGKGVGEISNCLFENAKSGNVTAQIFFLKAQGGWKETQIMEATGKDGAPLIPEHAITIQILEERVSEILNNPPKEQPIF